MTRITENDLHTLEHHIFPCDCHDGHYIAVQIDLEEPYDSYLFFEGQSIYTRGWERIKNAWRTLRGKECTWQSIVLDGATCASLQRTLDTVVEHHKKWEARQSRR